MRVAVHSDLSYPPLTDEALGTHTTHQLFYMTSTCSNRIYLDLHKVIAFHDLNAALAFYIPSLSVTSITPYQTLSYTIKSTRALILLNKFINLYMGLVYNIVLFTSTLRGLSIIC